MAEVQARNLPPESPRRPTAMIMHDALYGVPAKVSRWQRPAERSRKRRESMAIGYTRGRTGTLPAAAGLHSPARRWVPGGTTVESDLGPLPAVAALPGRQVLTDSVYDVVKQQIMDLKLAPSTRLNIDQLARELEVSNTPLREALARLEAEGLVSRRSLQGFTVAAVADRHDVDELFELRLMLEPEAARSASTRVGLDELALLRASVERLAELAADEGETGHYRRHRSLVLADEYFHDVIAECSGSKLLRRAVSGLHAHTTLYRVYFQVGYAPEGADTAEEHAAIVDALAERSPSGAARAMRNHIRRSHDRLRHIVRLHAEGRASDPETVGPT